MSATTDTEYHFQIFITVFVLFLVYIFFVIVRFGVESFLRLQEKLHQVSLSRQEVDYSRPFDTRQAFSGTQQRNGFYQNTENDDLKKKNSEMREENESIKREDKQKNETIQKNKETIENQTRMIGFREKHLRKLYRGVVDAMDDYRPLSDKITTGGETAWDDNKRVPIRNDEKKLANSMDLLHKAALNLKAEQYFEPSIPSLCAPYGTRARLEIRNPRHHDTNRNPRDAQSRRIISDR